jgi:acyl-CoA reductase-like NAD-dependent aldehyde dehydrogenase
MFSNMRISRGKKVFDGRCKRNILYATSSGLAVRANVSFLGFPLNDPSLLPLTSESLSPGENFSVHNPAALSQFHSSSVVATIPIVLPNGEEKNNFDFIHDAIQRSHRAQLAWKETTTLHRGSLLRAWFELIKQNAEDLATIMTKESGKTLAEAKSEVSYGASFVEYFSAVAVSSTNNSGGGVIIPSPFVKGDGISPRGMALSIKEPVGVAAMVRPTQKCCFRV